LHNFHGAHLPRRVENGRHNVVPRGHTSARVRGWWALISPATRTGSAAAIIADRRFFVITICA
jgi:hypothetical protein